MQGGDHRTTQVLLVFRSEQDTVLELSIPSLNNLNAADHVVIAFRPCVQPCMQTWMLLAMWIPVGSQFGAPQLRVCCSAVILDERESKIAPPRSPPTWPSPVTATCGCLYPIPSIPAHLGTSLHKPCRITDTGHETHISV